MTGPASGSAADWSAVGQRSLLEPAPGLRPFQDGALFDRIGGQVTVDRLVDSLYARFEADRVIRPLFGTHLATEREKQKLFFAEWLGGPYRYSESAYGGLSRHHEDLPITRPVAERWLGHLGAALRDAVPDERDAGLVLERAHSVALALVNDNGSPPMDGPAPASAARRHRSERVASCGVGARTLKSALSSAQRGKVDELAALVADVPDLIERPALAAGVLQRAALAGRGEVVAWLVDRGVDVNTPAPLDTSAFGGAFELVLFVTPLCAARMTHRSEISEELLRRGACDDIFTAAFLGDETFARRLLAERPSLAQVSDPATDVVTVTPIHHAVAGHQLATLGALLDHTTEPVRTGGRALRGAAASGSRAMVDLLLAHGADGRAVGAGRWVLDPEIAPRLAAAGASAGVGTDGEESGDWVRMSCTGNRGRKDDPAFVAALLRYGARVDQRYKGATPLHYAVKAGFVQTVLVLLAHGADRDAFDERGATPSDWLDRAAESVERAAVRSALMAG